MDPALIAALAAESAVLVPGTRSGAGSQRSSRPAGPCRRLGVPAHVTVLYPFVPPPAITATVIAGLAGAVGSVSAFDCEFAAVAWFGEEVAWLALRPDEPFRALTQAVSAAFPGYLPYGGAHEDVVPHLTIGDRPAGGVRELRAAEADVLRWLPIRARISRVWLMTGDPAPGSWQTAAELPLAAG